MSDPVVLLSTGDVVGPAGGVTDNSMVLFSGTSGKLIKGNNAVVTSAGLALLDDVNAAAQRVTLGLGTAATATLTTSATDTTAGRVLKVGDFGVGGMLDLRGTIFVTGKPQDLYSKGFVKGFADGGPAGLAIPGIVGISYGVLELDAHWYEPTGAGGIMRSFTQGYSGIVYTQTMANATTWGVWREIALTDSPAFTGIPTAPTASAGTSTTQLATTAFVTTAVGVGNVSLFATATPPTGWLKANGAAVNRATYAALFTAIGTTFGAGDGSTTFNVPDLRGEFVRGWDDGRGIDSGRVFGSAQTDEFKKHRHPQYEYDSGNSVPIPDGSFAYDLNTNITTGYERTALIGYAGGTETRPRNIAMLYCIKY